MPRLEKLKLTCGMALIAVGVTGLMWSQRRASAPSRAAAMDDSVVSLRVRFGITDTGPREWSGSATATDGDILTIRDWHPRPGNKIVGRSGWILSSYKAPVFQRRPWEEERLTGPPSFIIPAGIVLDVRAGVATRLNFQTKSGDFQVDLRALPGAGPLAFLNGRVAVDRVASAVSLSSDDYQADFATMLSGSNSEVWAAWTGYRDKGDEIFARRFDGRDWESAQKITDKPGDVFLVKMGRDRKGRPWVVWSAQVDHNWDLYARSFDGQRWSPVERLTDDPQPDVYHNLATDSSGNLWLVWQGFRNGKSDIFARRYDGNSWSAPERVSTSPANDWEPAIAADSNGRVYVAWDTYDKGNYDVMMRAYANGRWGDPVTVAGTPKYEAHVSLACDSQDRLWAAWNESGFQWGKDTGFLVRKEGTRLYQWRSIGIAIYANGEWREPVADLNESLPQEVRGYNDFPVLQSDPAGRTWVFFRHRTLRIPDTPSNTPAHRAAWEIYGVSYEGDHWSAPLAIPFSQDRIDVHAGFATDGGGNLYAAWPADNRDFEEFLFQRSQVYAGRLPARSKMMAETKLKPRVVPQLTALSIHPRESEDLARIRGYTIRSDGRTYHIYRGDTHRHTEFSMDGNNDGPLVDTYRYAIDAAQLDFLGLSDHNNFGGPDVEYINWLEQKMADVWMLPQTFTPLYAYERSVAYPNGHRNVLFAERGHPTLPIPQEEQQGKVGAQALYDYLKQRHGIAIPHTSASTMGTDWRDNDPQVEPLVEIYQGDRVSAEYEGAPKAAYAASPASAPGGFRPKGYVWNAWAKGYKLGVQASSDHLSTHISYACTLAADFTRQALLDAMRQRHSYGATDNIILDYRLQTGDREYLQGDIVTVPGEFKLWVRVIGTQPIRQIDLVKNNAFIHTLQPLQPEASFSFVDHQASSGQSYYYVRVIQVDEQMAWSSPIWVTKK